jgi:hypothetical protein
MQGLKIGKIHRNRSDKRVRELLNEMPFLGITIEHSGKPDPLLEARCRMWLHRFGTDSQEREFAGWDVQRACE